MGAYLDLRQHLHFLVRLGWSSHHVLDFLLRRTQSTRKKDKADSKLVVLSALLEQESKCADLPSLASLKKREFYGTALAKAEETLFFAEITMNLPMIKSLKTTLNSITLSLCTKDHF